MFHCIANQSHTSLEENPDWNIHVKDSIMNNRRDKGCNLHRTGIEVHENGEWRIIGLHFPQGLSLWIAPWWFPESSCHGDSPWLRYLPFRHYNANNYPKQFSWLALIHFHGCFELHFNKFYLSDVLKRNDNDNDKDNTTKKRVTVGLVVEVFPRKHCFSISFYIFYQNIIVWESEDKVKLLFCEFHSVNGALLLALQTYPIPQHSIWVSSHRLSSCLFINLNNVERSLT